MNKFADDLRAVITPEIVVLDSVDFQNEADREAYIQRHSAGHYILVDVVDSNGNIIWEDNGMVRKEE